MVNEQITRTVSTFGARTRLLRRRVEVFIDRTWGSLSSWHDKDIDRFVSQVIPVLAASRLDMATMTDAYLAAVETLLLEEAVGLVGVRPKDVTLDELRGVPAPEVYRRPGVTVWTALSAGQALELAVEKGRQRALSLATTDLQLAKTHTANRILKSKNNVVGYRRVLQGKSCALCAVAATQRYHSGDLMPIHPACDCSVLPIYGDVDPGQVIDPDSLEGIHDLIAERFGASSRAARGIPGSAVDYQDVLVVNEHGELGPVLGVRGHHFTGPEDI